MLLASTEQFIYKSLICQNAKITGLSSPFFWLIWIGRPIQKEQGSMQVAMLIVRFRIKKLFRFYHSVIKCPVSVVLGLVASLLGFNFGFNNEQQTAVLILHPQFCRYNNIK